MYNPLGLSDQELAIGDTRERLQQLCGYRYDKYLSKEVQAKVSDLLSKRIHDPISLHTINKLYKNKDPEMHAKMLEGQIPRDQALGLLNDLIREVRQEIKFVTIGRKKLGTFEVVSGKLTIGDPCYAANEELPKVRNGTWVAHRRAVLDTIFTSPGAKDTHGCRISLLIATNIDAKKGKWVPAGSFGVDSGQAGIFDSKSYRRTSDWYDDCCSLTLSPQQAGILPRGVVSASGYGDGGYEYRVLREDDEIVGIRLRFI